MKNILIIYSTNNGQTLKICRRLKDVLLQKNQKVTLLSVDDKTTTDLASFDKIIIGASIKYGKHCIKMHHFINQHLHILNTKPNAFFSVNMVARKPEKNTPETNPYLKKFLNKIAWEPKELAVFAGEVDYPSYNIFDRLIIQFIMWMTKGPTDPTVRVEYTNWQQVEKFAEVIENI